MVFMVVQCGTQRRNSTVARRLRTQVTHPTIANHGYTSEYQQEDDEQIREGKGFVTIKVGRFDFLFAFQAIIDQNKTFKTIVSLQPLVVAVTSSH